MSYRSDVKIRLKGKRLAEIVEKMDNYVESKPESYHENVARQFSHFKVLDVTPDNDDVYIELSYYGVKWYYEDVDEFMELVTSSDDYAYARIGEEQGDVETSCSGEIDPIYIRSTFDDDDENNNDEETRESDAVIYNNIFKY